MADAGFKIKGVKFEDHALIIERGRKRVKVKRGDNGLWDVLTEAAEGFYPTFGAMGFRDAIQNAKELLGGDEL
ncbi:hypothetical protein [Kroppenstedtia sanguinis]|uniref:Uncharacterized protein n=1 Tax=Kroppenstedtia sanguinis TaxID=1380684 RepID=A0ABW4C4Z2_9BACL